MDNTGHGKAAPPSELLLVPVESVKFEICTLVKSSRRAEAAIAVAWGWWLKYPRVWTMMCVLQE